MHVDGSYVGTVALYLSIVYLGIITENVLVKESVILRVIRWRYYAVNG